MTHPVGFPGLLINTILVDEEIDFNNSWKSIFQPLLPNVKETSLITPFLSNTEDFIFGHTGPTITTSSLSERIKSQTNLNPIIPPVTTL